MKLTIKRNSLDPRVVTITGAGPHDVWCGWWPGEQNGGFDPRASTVFRASVRVAAKRERVSMEAPDAPRD